MWFGLLGPVIAGPDPGHAAPVGSPMQRAVLAALLVRANQDVSAEHLVEAVWGPTPPPSHAASLQNHVMRLRRLVGDHDMSRIRARPQGYRLEVADGELDLHRFTALIGRSREARGARDWASAASALGRALELWRGEPMADVPPHADFAAEAARMSEMRLQALQWRIDSELRLGRHDELVSELTVLAGTHPLIEGFHAQLMTALYRTGRQGEALAAFHRARTVLAEELGIDPGHELDSLHRRILASDPELLDVAPTGSAATAAALPVPRQLPGDIRHFTGRADELKAICGSVDEAFGSGTAATLWTIEGTAGVGKTALAVRCAHLMAQHFSDGQLFVNLQGFTPAGGPLAPDTVLRDFLLALGEPAERIPEGVEARSALYRSLMADRRVLVVLDNARDAAQARPLLPGGSGCLAVITSRNRLTALIAAEGARPVTLDLMTAAEARDLLGRQLDAEQVAAEAEAAGRLIRLCARLPLALSIASARATPGSARTLATLADELGDAGSRLDRLETGDSVTDVRAVFSWSYHLLSEAARRMFRLLSLNPGPDISPRAAASLVRVPLRESRATIAELVRAHLVTEDSAGRISFHDLLRAYAAEVAAESESAEGRDGALEELLSWYLNTLDDARHTLVPQAPRRPPYGRRPLEALPFDTYDEALAWIESEKDNLITAVYTSFDDSRHEYTWRLTLPLMSLFNLRKLWPEWIATHETALAATQALGDRRAECMVRNNLAIAYQESGRPDDAVACLERALELMREHGTLGERVIVLTNLGLSQYSAGRAREALATMGEGLDAAREVGDGYGESLNLANLAEVSKGLGRLKEAIEYSEGAIAAARAIGSTYGERLALNHLSEAHRLLGNAENASQYGHEALAINREAGDRAGEAAALLNLSRAAQALGRIADARGYQRDALAILEEIQDSRAAGARARLEGLSAVSDL